MPKFLKFAIILVSFLILAFFAQEFTRVKEVELVNTSCVGEDQLGVKGKLIATLSEKQLEKDIKEKFSCVASLKLKKIYPAKVRLELEGENPVAKIANSQYLITASGLVIIGSQQNLPTLYLTATTAVSPDQKVMDEIAIHAAKLASLIVKSDFHAANIRIIGSDIAVYDAQDSVAIFSSIKALATQVDSLQLVLSAAKMGEPKIAKIDLRFEKPVITFK
ncbi:hypothetical protein HYZ70_02595 [Candidatus Curtissbacteria bacterium]|nr:hypothetical protein [Candidatus Curtissbacteria bacterium]